MTDHIHTYRPLTIAELAELLDDCADSHGQWDGGDVCEALSDIIGRGGGWKRCAEHGVYSATKPTCPFDHGQLDDE
jgi:hypothetical protein